MWEELAGQVVHRDQSANYAYLKTLYTLDYAQCCCKKTIVIVSMPFAFNISVNRSVNQS